MNSDGTSGARPSGFATEVLAHCSFLENDFGFRPVDVQDTFVRYEAQAGRFVNVYYGQSSYELKFEVGRRQQSGVEEKYYPVDFVRQDGSEEEHYFQATTADRLRQFLPRLAAFLQTHAADALRGDESPFRRLQNTQRGQSDELRLKWALEDARREADEAWRLKDYDRLVQVYIPFVDQLAPSERRKLAYAQKHR